MQSRMIFNWDNIETHQLYTDALKRSPLYFDEDHNTWVSYRYEYCKAILLHENAHIPQPAFNPLLNANANLLISKLVRLSNGEQHRDARQAAEELYNSMQPVSVSDILASLLKDIKQYKAFDWVATVCKQLPVLYLLKGFGFTADDCLYVLNHITTLVRIMTPQKSPDEILMINPVIDNFFTLSEKYIPGNGGQNKNERDLRVFNLIGLLIQSYDAGRGLLCNALIQVLANTDQLKQRDSGYFRQAVIETLRFDPPVHNIKRVAVGDKIIDGQLIKAGENILIVFAAANLDPHVFEVPLCYNPTRFNNNNHLTFGTGGHGCMAKNLMINMATKSIQYLSQRFDHIQIQQQPIQYEPQLNVRLVKQLFITVS